MTTVPLGVGLLGFGNAGRFFHAPLINATPGLSLRSIVTTRSWAREEYPNVQVLDSVEALLSSSEIDLVVVATPNQQHVVHARAALAAGKHIVVEKPVADSSETVERLYTQAAQSERMLMVFHNRRWDGDFLTVKKIVDSGVLGKIHEYEANWPLYMPNLRGVWRENPDELGGVLYDLGPHLLDQVLVLFGRPNSVYAQVDTHRAGARADDFFRLHLRYPSGMNAILATDLLTPSPGPRFRLRGSNGTFEKYGVDPQEAALRAGRRPDDTAWGEEQPSQWGHLWVRELHGMAFDGSIPTLRGDYTQFYKAVYEALLGKTESPIEQDLVVEQIRIIEASNRSAKSSSVVQLQ